MEIKIIILILCMYLVLVIINTFVEHKKVIIMKKGKKEEKGLANSLLNIAAIFGGAWLTAKLLENHSDKKVLYSCPNCNSDVDYQQGNCNMCKSKLKWEF